LTKAERAYIGKAVSLGCCLCRHLGLGETLSEYHHRRTGTGAGKRASHFDGFPLCFFHHRGSNEAIHTMGRKAFEKHFGVTEQQFIDQTKEMVG
jgi:hypothetical protein